MVLTDAEDVQPDLVGEHREVDELPQTHGRVDRSTGGGIGGDLPEGEQTDLERAAVAHHVPSPVSASPSSQLRSSPTTCALMPWPPGSRTPVVTLPASSWR